MPHGLRALLALNIVALVGSGGARAACPASPDALQAEAETAIASFARADGATFSEAYTAMSASLSCLNAAPSPSQSALVHQADALYWFQARDQGAAMDAFQAMHEVEPTLTLSESVAPKGGFVYNWYLEAAARPPSAKAEVALARRVSLSIDGMNATSRPVDRPALAVLSAEGRVLWSGLLPVGGDLPRVELEREKIPPRRLAGVAVLSAAGVSTVAAGGMWVAALQGRGEVLQLRDDIAAGGGVEDVGLSPDEASELYDSAKRQGYTAQAVSGVALGLVSLGLVLMW